MAAALKERGVQPDLIVSSSANRAITTARIVAGEMGYSEDAILRTPELYLAPPAMILRIVQQLDESAGTAMVFGHNPGMHEAANALSVGAQITGFPTLTVARFEFREEHWGLLEWGAGQFVELITPHDLRTG